MKTVTRLDKAFLIASVAIFGSVSAVGWYLRAFVGGVDGQSLAGLVFDIGLIALVALGMVRGHLKKKAPPPSGN